MLHLVRKARVKAINTFLIGILRYVTPVNGAWEGFDVLTFLVDIPAPKLAEW